MSRILWKRITSSLREPLALIFFLLVFVSAFAQEGGVTGINKATELVKTYFTAAQLLLYAIGGVIGIIGAVKVYNKWTQGEPDTNKTAASWFGACIFLVLVATLLKAFFNLG